MNNVCWIILEKIRYKKECYGWVCENRRNGERRNLREREGEKMGFM